MTSCGCSGPVTLIPQSSTPASTSAPTCTSMPASTRATPPPPVTQLPVPAACTPLFGTAPRPSQHQHPEPSTMEHFSSPASHAAATCDRPVPRAELPAIVHAALRAVVGTAGEGRQTDQMARFSTLELPRQTLAQTPRHDPAHTTSVPGWAPIKAPHVSVVDDVDVIADGDDDGRRAGRRHRRSSWTQSLIHASHVAAIMLIPALVTVLLVTMMTR